MIKLVIVYLALFTVSVSVSAGGGWLLDVGKSSGTAALVASCLKIKPVLCKPSTLDQLAYMTIHNKQIRKIVSKSFNAKTNNQSFRNKMASNSQLQARFKYVKATLRL